jgi:predicted nucleic acid-binding protein
MLVVFTRASVLMDKYADQPMDFADATLVVLAERLRVTSIFTIDRDFRVYRAGRKAFRWVLA